jgi:hypothetical protein
MEEKTITLEYLNQLVEESNKHIKEINEDLANSTRKQKHSLQKMV